MTERRDIRSVRDALDAPGVGTEMHDLIVRLYPICRSITGDGLRESLRILGQSAPIEVHEVPSHTPVLDWTVPKEWNIRDAYIKDVSGRRVVDFRSSNLHVVSYSAPVHRTMSLAELDRHLHSLPEHPEWIPYRTSYYDDDGWGFCLAHAVRSSLEEGDYEVCIDSTLTDGSLSYGEAVVPGETEDEVLVSCHVCHPSLCNENLSGAVVAAFLARLLGRCALRFTYRFLFIPTTIGSITWLARNRDRLARIKHGLVAACLGDPGAMTYKRSRRGDADIDRAALHVLDRSGAPHKILEWSPYGFDERQFCSPGFDLPVGSLTRSTHDQFPEYHTSADDTDLVRPEFLADSLAEYLEIFEVLEGNRRYRSLSPYGEPQLGRRGLYRRVGGQADGRASELPLLWVLNMSDGDHTLLDIAERAGIAFRDVRRAADVLVEAELLEVCD